MYISYNTVSKKDTNVTLKPIIAKLKNPPWIPRTILRYFFMCINKSTNKNIGGQAGGGRVEDFAIIRNEYVRGTCA